MFVKLKTQLAFCRTGAHLCVSAELAVSTLLGADGTRYFAQRVPGTAGGVFMCYTVCSPSGRLHVCAKQTWVDGQNAKEYTQFARRYPSRNLDMVPGGHLTRNLVVSLKSLN